MSPPDDLIIDTSQHSIIRSGLAAARANLIPGLLLQAVMIGILVAHAISPVARATFDHLVEIKAASGYLFAFIATAVAGGLLPEVLRFALFQKFRPQRDNFTNLLFGLLFWGGMGVLIDAFYRLQTQLFGGDPTAATVITKVLVDMLLFTPFVGVPLAATAYLWKGHGFDPAILGDVLNLRGYRRHILPVLIPNWAVWGPVVCVIYALPVGLQIPVYVLAQAFWTLVLTTLTAKSATP